MSNESFLHPLAEVFILPSSISVVQGTDALEHLNRSLTTDTTQLRLHGKQESLLCNANGRILDRLTLCNLEERVILVGNHGTGGDTRQQLIQGVPWDQDVAILDGDTAIGHLKLVGKAVDRCLVGLDLDSTDIDLQSWTEFGNSLISRTEVGDSLVTEILVPTAEIDNLVNILIDNGAIMIDSDRWSELRIRLGILDSNEMNPSNLPFELGLHELVKLDKGCYPGQEIHARMDSKGRLARTLVRLDCNTPPAVGKHVIPGIGRVVVTSNAQYEGGGVALAIIPNEAKGMDELVFDDGSTAKMELI
mgnify:CR=1 FL=1